MVPRYWGVIRHDDRRRIRLRFSKTGNPNVEAAYSTHYASGRLATRRDQVNLADAERPRALLSKPAC